VADLQTCLTGVWEGGRLVTARRANLASLDTTGSQLEIVCSPPRPSTPTFTFSPADQDSFGCCDPLVRDPYESGTVEVRGSGMEGGGEGVFARRALPAQTLAAVFNGYRVPLYGGTHPATGIDDEQERYERLAYNIHMPEDENFYIDFPPNQADTRKYCASLGHKVVYKRI